MKKTKYEKPMVLKLGYDTELVFGDCGGGGGVATDCANGKRAGGCNVGQNVGTCTNGNGPPAS
ncbi:MAG: hypothetical protein P8075_10255 [Deltaproteobacteria bacterium]